MGRPAKSINAKTGTITKAEEEARKKIEEITKGKADKLKPPRYLSKKQKEVFKYIISELDEAKLLGNLDVFILARAAVTIEQLQEFDKKSNENPEILLEKEFRMARSEAEKSFFRCCNELCLSPQARAKISISAAKPEDTKKTLMDLLNEDEDEDDE